MRRLLPALTATLAAIVAGPALAGSITLYSEAGFEGESATLRRDVENLSHYAPWNDRARSLVVNSGTWEVCKHKNFNDCVVLKQGSQLADLGRIGFYGEISSLRELDSFGRDDRRRHADRDDRRGRDPWSDPWHDPWGGGPGWGPSPRPRDRIDWDDPPNRLSKCQRRVADGFAERYGYRERIRFDGRKDDGTVWWGDDPWRYRCRDGQVNIWRP